MIDSPTRQGDLALAQSQGGIFPIKGKDNSGIPGRICARAKHGMAGFGWEDAREAEP
jgi:hypothetical protein